jgi:hypothetical protein
MPYIDYKVEEDKVGRLAGSRVRLKWDMTITSGTKC